MNVTIFLITDLGPSEWNTEAVPDRPHQHSTRPCGQPQAALSLFLRGGQTGQVLGSRVQQGNGRVNFLKLHFLFCHINYHYWFGTINSVFNILQTCRKISGSELH